MTATTRNVLIAGATGYMGRPLSAELIQRGHRVAGIVRPGSEGKLARGCEALSGNVLDLSSFQAEPARFDTLVQLVGVAHPSPSKAAEFESIDLRSCMESLALAKRSGIAHFVYVSVAHPAPAMKAYIAVRMRCEQAIRESGIAATFIRPWYVLGEGHRWPYALLPFYWLAERTAKFREGALRLGLVTLPQMISALAHAVENPPAGVRIVEVPEIRGIGNAARRLRAQTAAATSAR
jgi:uncharacterized protein YbjT (DUF2867 family)